MKRDNRIEYETAKRLVASEEDCAILGPFSVRRLRDCIVSYEANGSWPSMDEELEFMRSHSQ